MMYRNPRLLRAYIAKLSSGDVSLQHARGLVAEWEAKDARCSEDRTAGRGETFTALFDQFVKLFSEREWVAYLLGVMHARGYVMYRALDPRRTADPEDSCLRQGLHEQAYFLDESAVGLVDAWRLARTDGPGDDEVHDNWDDDPIDPWKARRNLFVKYFVAPR